MNDPIACIQAIISENAENSAAVKRLEKANARMVEELATARAEHQRAISRCDQLEATVSNKETIRLQLVEQVRKLQERVNKLNTAIAVLRESPASEDPAETVSVDPVFGPTDALT